MTCKMIGIPNGMIFLCGRNKDQPRCTEPGCQTPAAALCDWPLGGTKWGKTCSRPLCAGCRVSQPVEACSTDTKDYCQGHDKVAKMPHVWCPRCHVASWNPHDVEKLYCGRCKLFHTDIAPVSSGNPSPSVGEDGRLHVTSPTQRPPVLPEASPAVPEPGRLVPVLPDDYPF